MVFVGQALQACGGSGLELHGIHLLVRRVRLRDVGVAVQVAQAGTPGGDDMGAAHTQGACVEGALYHLFLLELTMQLVLHPCSPKFGLAVIAEVAVGLLVLLLVARLGVAPPFPSIVQDHTLAQHLIRLDLVLQHWEAARVELFRVGPHLLPLLPKHFFTHRLFLELGGVELLSGVVEHLHTLQEGGVRNLLRPERGVLLTHLLHGLYVTGGHVRRGLQCPLLQGPEEVLVDGVHWRLQLDRRCPQLGLLLYLFVRVIVCIASVSLLINGLLRCVLGGLRHPRLGGLRAVRAVLVDSLAVQLLVRDEGPVLRLDEEDVFGRWERALCL
mmetsp:Transcript_129022/g.275368  ORF Transcript_129022/g.275368 Transcript_129022/m.275368 type:complete len:328 (-) Transcript_129022:1975-2958(-)